MTFLGVSDPWLVVALFVVVSAVVGYAVWRGRGPAPARFLTTSLLISSVLVVPFLVLEWVNRRASFSELPLGLFAYMAVHALLIVLLLTPPLRGLVTNARLRALNPGHWAGLVLGSVLAVAYVGLLIDQFPCFLGVPNCD